MRRIIFFFIISALLIACQKTRHADDRRQLFSDIAVEILPTATSPDNHERAEKIRKELEYYFQRHTVDDEGYDMVVRYAESGDSLLSDYLPKGHPTLLSLFKWIRLKRHGTGMDCRDGCVYIATWNADTVVSGLRVDTSGIYAGEFNRQMQASGHGCYRGFDGTYYEGHWQNDCRDGFGFGVSTRNLQAGTWKAGRFLGERMQHTNNRIYGIDISRYQHEKGRKRFGINWKDLRVTSLGRRIKGNVSGEIDYPVRFVYIKSTQGTSIRNRYLMTDYAAARKQGVPVGVYHFFSTLQSGREQANYFLNHSLFRHGDLPPVLDIEPTDRQIQKMGGTSVLLREIHAWLSTVERRLHVRPILYVNQNFVNKHLSADPHLLDSYLIWIARYGEYKPGMHLALWQLSQDSRVKGIQTDVDVNVFNGYEAHWQEFLQEETIK